jgi:hypothetical protein
VTKLSWEDITMTVELHPLVTSRWNSFDEGAPRYGKLVELASHSKAADRPFTWEAGCTAEAHADGFTHWRYYKPATDLPEPPLPELPVLPAKYRWVESSVDGSWAISVIGVDHLSYWSRGGVLRALDDDDVPVWAAKAIIEANGL